MSMAAFCYPELDETRSTVEFIGLWEIINNPDFKRVEFNTFKNETGSNAFVLTPQKWITATNAIGILSKTGRYGGTYALALRPPGYCRRAQIAWNITRTLARINYRTLGIRDVLQIISFLIEVLLRRIIL